MMELTSAYHDSNWEETVSLKIEFGIEAETKL